MQLYNRGLLGPGLVVVGTLAYMAWLNEYGAISVAARTQDVDLARSQRLKLGASVSFLSSVQATQLPFKSIPGLPSHEPATSGKLPGREGLRVDVLAPGPMIGETVRVPELDWYAQTVPYYDYLLEDCRPGAVLAGGHCIPVTLPRIERMVWHKFYSCKSRINEPEKAQKDLFQAVTLAALVVEHDGAMLEESYREAPEALRSAVKARLPRIQELSAYHPQVRDAFADLAAR